VLHIYIYIYIYIYDISHLRVNDFRLAMLGWLRMLNECDFPVRKEAIVAFVKVVYLNVHESVHRDTVMKVTNKIQLCRLIYYSKSAVHVSGDVFAHHQEHLTVFTVPGSIHPKLYRTVIRPVVTYVSETMVLKEAIIQKLLVFEKKILRRIFGPTKENQIWRVKTNEELDKLIKHKNIINHIKAQRLIWFGHVQRMPDTRTVKKIFNWKPLTKRSQGRPKYRWEDNIKQDICQMKIKNWIACV